MPLYEFHCRDCEQEVEVLLRQPEEKAICPTCGSKKMEKLLSVISSPVMASSKSSCATPTMSQGGCGKPQCGTGGCMFG